MRIYRLRGGRCAAEARPRSDLQVQRTETDHEHLARAIELAERGVGSVSPNPVVGAVVVKDGKVLGEGWHDEYGGPHAEVNAIAAARRRRPARARRSTSRWSRAATRARQPPCTDAILAAGIGRVVVASDDPTEKASGRGLGILRDEGVEVDLAGGELAARRALAEPGLPQARAHRAPVGALQVGDEPRRQGGDAGPATRSGSPPRTAARSPTAGAPRRRGRRRHRHRAGRRPAADRAHRRRAPPAAARRLRRHRPPAAGLQARRGRRPRSRSPSSSRARRRAAPTDALRERRRRGHRRHRRERAGPRALGARPARRAPAITSVLLEGGPHLAGAFLDAGEIDELRLFIAPLLLGGRSARDPLEGEGVERSPTRCAR